MLFRKFNAEAQAKGLYKAMEGLGTAMITGKQSGNFDVAAQLKACVDAIKKTTK